MDSSGSPRGHSRMGRYLADHPGSFAPVMVHFIDDIASRFLWIAQVIIAASLCVVAWFAMDREPPFAVLSVEPAAAKIGETVMIKAKVRRDVSRHCAADFTRYVFDVNDVRFFIDDGRASSDMIDRMEKRTPGELKVAFVVPNVANPGPATLETVLHYQCNRIHKIWPIEVTTTMPFTVLP